ncbi:hypothetical protein EV663_1081 [Rhodovulum bhavnagarense]|uniref:AAA domain-containing protein n=2 Tax=Rhodovulum bhavnagarense TaxID=992286 RepID=A0A4R2RN74_9RHOB|nr:hypothetical protein EV663_1081 [Rhodovulum bhavnagarense]
MVQQVHIGMKNCYGIDALEHTFDFSNNNMPVLVYAPNGVMKTSLAKTMRQYALNKKPEDIFFPERVSELSIADEGGQAIDRESVFVIDSVDDKYQSSRISTLLASEELKARYDDIFGSIAEKKEKLFKALKKPSGLSKDIDAAIAGAFKVRKEDVLVALARLEREVKEGAHSQFSGLKYKTLFSDKVLEFLQNSDVKTLIDDYTKIYEQILDSSLYFKKGVFNHSNAETIAKNLKSNGWFDGGHSVNLNHQGERSEISTEAELIDAIESEKQKILTDPKLAEMFQKVDNTLTTAELRNFRDYLIENPFVVAELSDIDAFKQRVWISYLVESSSEYFDLIEEYDSSKEKIKEIIGEAEKEQTRWESVISQFNDRFSVPFTVKVENKGDAVLNVSAPQITFYVEDRDNGAPRKTDRNILDKGLSNGEKRALYILNIIFEVEARRKAGIETLVVLDDIADSFDYKNKYAIIEYLNDMRSEENFHLIILTHNYDFYRTVRGRLGVFGDNKLLCNRLNGALQLIPDSISDNPFETWKNNLTTPVVLVASVPFVRNLAEYVGNEEAFQTLTSLLHMKDQTQALTVQDLHTVYQSVLAAGSFTDFSGIGGSVFDLIMSVCGEICDLDDDNLTLEQKIALSVGIRLVAEQVLIDEINDPEYVGAIRKNQTSKLIRKYERSGDCDEKVLRAVKRVALMTPENIHLNSFMFEPILDMSGHHLKALFADIKACIEA